MRDILAPQDVLHKLVRITQIGQTEQWWPSMMQVSRPACRGSHSLLANVMKAGCSIPEFCVRESWPNCSPTLGHPGHPCHTMSVPQATHSWPAQRVNHFGLTKIMNFQYNFEHAKMMVVNLSFCFGQNASRNDLFWLSVNDRFRYGIFGKWKLFLLPFFFRVGKFLVNFTFHLTFQATKMILNIFSFAPGKI